MSDSSKQHRDSSKNVNENVSLLEAPALSEEPNFEHVETAYEALASLDVRFATVQSTIEKIGTFLDQALDELQSKNQKTVEEDGEELQLVGSTLEETSKTFVLTTTSIGSSSSSSRNNQNGEEEVEEDKRLPQEMTEELIRNEVSLVKHAILSKLTEFLDERLATDRYSLVAEKKRAKKQLYVAREMSEVFRRSYDTASRFRQSEEVRIVQNEADKKFNKATKELSATIEHLEFSNRLITGKLSQRDQQIEQLEEALKAAHEEVKRLTLSEKMLKLAQKGGAASKKIAHGHGHGGGGHGGHVVLHDDASAAPYHHANTVHGTSDPLAHHASTPSAESSFLVADQHDDILHPHVQAPVTITIKEPCSNCTHLEMKITTLSNSIRQLELDAEAAKLVHHQQVQQVQHHLQQQQEQHLLQLQQHQHHHHHQQQQQQQAVHVHSSLPPSPTGSQNGKSVVTVLSGNMTPLLMTPGNMSPASPPPERRKSLDQQDGEDVSSPPHPLTKRGSSISSDGMSEGGTTEIKAGGVAKLRGESRTASPLTLPAPDLSDELLDNEAEGEEANEGPLVGNVGGVDEEEVEAVHAGEDFSLEIVGTSLQMLDQSSPPSHHVTEEGEVCAEEEAEEAEDVMLQGKSAEEEQDFFDAAVQNSGLLIRTDSVVFGNLESESISPSHIASSVGQYNNPSNLDLGSLCLSTDSATIMVQSQSDVGGGGGRGAGNVHGENSYGSLVEGNHTAANLENNFSIITKYLKEHKKLSPNISYKIFSAPDLASILVEQFKSQKELETKVLSSDFHNSQLSERIRSDEAYIEQQEKLHALQMLERGILLKELSRQVAEQRSSIHQLNKQVQSYASSKDLEKRVKGVKSRQSSSESKRNEITLPAMNIDSQNSSSMPSMQDNISGRQSHSRMLAASASLPILSDEYGAFSTSQSVPNLTMSANTSTRPQSRAESPIRRQQHSSGGGGASGGEMTAGKFTADVGSETFAMGAERLAELKAVRKQIVSLIAARYPERKGEKRLAVSKARDEKLEGRSLSLRTASPENRKPSPKR